MRDLLLPPSYIEPTIDIWPITDRPAVNFNGWIVKVSSNVASPGKEIRLTVWSVCTTVNNGP